MLFCPNRRFALVSYCAFESVAFTAFFNSVFTGLPPFCNRYSHPQKGIWPHLYYNLPISFIQSIFTFGRWTKEKLQTWHRLGVLIPSISSGELPRIVLQRPATFPHISINLSWISGCSLQVYKIFCATFLHVGVSIHSPGANWTASGLFPFSSAGDTVIRLLSRIVSFMSVRSSPLRYIWSSASHFVFTSCHISSLSSSISCS